MYRITRLARQFGLSRSTLLYYDRIGLLSPSERSDAGYRLYSPADRQRLASICSYRQAGLGIEDIRRLLATAAEGGEAVIRRRLQEIGDEIRGLQAQQRLLAGMLRLQSGGELPARVDKETWVAMLRAAGMDDQAMERWHAEFERRAPGAHHAFLLSLGITDKEALLIRHWSAARPAQVKSPIPCDSTPDDTPL
jgi:DNA-binding transcriptional MerR regulator